MESNMFKSKRQELLVMISLLLTSSGTWVYAILMPTLTEIYEEFPCSPFWQAFIITGPSLVAIPLLLLTGVASKYVDKKTLMIVNLAIFSVGGIGGAFVHSLPMLIITRILAGVPAIVLLVPTLSIISELWKDEKRRSKVVGFYYGFNGAYGAVLALAAGFLAEINWRAAFLLNGITVIALIMVIIFVPKLKPEGKMKEDEITADAETTGGVTKFNAKGFWLLMAAMTVAGVFGVAMYYLQSVYVAEESLGGATYVGTVSSVMGIVNAVVAFVFGWIYIKGGKWLHPLMFILCGAVTLLFVLELNQVTALVAFAITGGAMALVACYYPAKLVDYVPQSRMTFYMAVFETIFYGTSFACAYMPLVIGSVTGNYTVAYSCMWMSAILLIVGAAMLAVTIVKKNNAVEKTE